MQKVVSSLVHDDLLHQVDTLKSVKPQLPLLPGADEPWEYDELGSDSTSHSGVWNLQTLDQALGEMERASKKGGIARTVCFQLISEM